MVEWRQIPDFPNYIISENGDVWRIAGGRHKRAAKNCLKPRLNDGYWKVQIYGPDGPKTIGIHRLLAISFISPPPSPEHLAAHNNGIKLDNRIKNIRWATPLENTADRALHGTQCLGEDNPSCVLTDSLVRIMREMHRSGQYTQRFLADLCGVSRTQMSRIITRQSRIEAGDFQWQI